MGSTCLGGFIFWCEQVFEWRGSHGVVGRGGEVPFVQMEDNRGSPLIEVWVLGAGAPCDGTSTVGLWAGGFFFFFLVRRSSWESSSAAERTGTESEWCLEKVGFVVLTGVGKARGRCAWDPGFLKQRGWWPLPFCEWMDWKSGFERTYPPSEQVGVGWFSKTFISPGFLFVNATKAKHFHYEF